MIDAPALRQRNARRATTFIGIPLAALFMGCVVHYSHPLPPTLPIAGDYMLSVQNGDWKQEASLSGSPATTGVWRKLITEYGPIQSCDMIGFKNYNIAVLDTRSEYTYDVQGLRGHAAVAVTLIPNEHRTWSVSEVKVLPASMAVSNPAMSATAGAAVPQSVLPSSTPAAVGAHAQLQLKEPFTLRFAVTHRNRRPEYNSDYQITWSARDGKLYYQYKTTKGECETDVYDGHTTYALSYQKNPSPHEIESGQISIFPGIRVGQAGYATGEAVEVMPGVGLPYLPFKVQEEPSSAAANPGVHYVQGEISGENYSFTSPPITSEKARFDFSGSQLSKIEFAYGDYWKFQDHRPFQGVMLPAEIKSVSFITPNEAIVANQRQINGIRTYHLLEASKNPLPASEFDYHTWPKPNMSIQDYRKANLTMISWQANRGTVEAQLARAPKRN